MFNWYNDWSNVIGVLSCLSSCLVYNFIKFAYCIFLHTYKLWMLIFSNNKKKRTGIMIKVCKRYELLFTIILFTIICNYRTQYYASSTVRSKHLCVGWSIKCTTIIILSKLRSLSCIPIYIIYPGSPHSILDPYITFLPGPPRPYKIIYSV